MTVLRHGEDASKLHERTERPTSVVTGQLKLASVLKRRTTLG